MQSEALNGPAAGGRGMSLLNALYYAFKPFLPRAVRYSMRRLRANYILLTARDWPILESAARPPAGWPGWPDGKKFAVVLTHDVEGPIGVQRCRALADLELRLGFRSSFNFVPEGGYVVSPELRADLVRDGFEIGVHDLRHDGSLYRSRAAFDQAAPRINHYLREWNAVGFRAGFMFHNLEWLKSLDVEYDASTFDTDPFEPQPDGVGTVFPFWVTGRRPGAGYVELPYTLSQDSTLFLVLRQPDISLWKTKVDWLASRGGMVLLNLHPDYLAFGDRPPGISEFAARKYEELLQYLRDRYAGAYWQALPRDVARYCRAHLAPVVNSASSLTPAAGVSR